MIIGFTGQKEVGKDTAGAHLIKAWDFERRAFADPLKKAAAALFNIPFWEVDKHKSDPTVFAALGYKNEPTSTHVVELPDGSLGASQPAHMWSPISEYTFRHLLQRLGTEVGRNIFGENFWVDQCLPVGGYYAGRKIVVTDVRFQNEVDRIHEIGGIVCRIKRPAVNAEVPDHASEENALLKGVDYEIMNDTTVDDFLEEVDKMLDWIFE